MPPGPDYARRMATTSRAEPDVRQVQRRTVLLLGSAQLLSGIGTGATVSIGSLLAVDLSGSEAWAGSVATVMTLAAALAALPLASLAERRGRRIGLATGLAAALAGALLIVVSVVSGHFRVPGAWRGRRRRGHSRQPAGAFRRRRPGGR